MTCRICGENKTTIFYKGVKGYGINRSFDLRQCQRCGIIFTYPYLTAEQTTAYYDSQETAFSGGGGEKLVTDYLLNKNKYWDRLGFKLRLDEILRVNPRVKTILDVGCGAGFFLDYCREMGLKTYGLEISDYGYNIAFNKLNLKVFKSTLESIPPKSIPSVDSITMYDVLEHTSNPAESLEIAKRMLRRGGILVINLPNIDSFVSKITGKYWNKLIPPNHTFFFDKKTLSALVTSVDLKVKEISTINGDSAELISESLASFWRLPAKLSHSIERAYYWKDDSISLHKSFESIMVKGSRKIFTSLGFMGVILKPILTKLGSGEGIHLIATK